MSFDQLECPRCGEKVRQYRNPFPTVDVIVEREGAVLLVERRNEPKGWALPGGFVDYGESLETAAKREMQEETGLKVENLRLVGIYSDPARDDRFHTISTVYAADAQGEPEAADDAVAVRFFRLDALPGDICFDHGDILRDYSELKRLRRI